MLRRILAAAGGAVLAVTLSAAGASAVTIGNTPPATQALTNGNADNLSGGAYGTQLVVRDLTGGTVTWLAINEQVQGAQPYWEIQNAAGQCANVSPRNHGVFAQRCVIGDANELFAFGLGGNGFTIQNLATHLNLTATGKDFSAVVVGGGPATDRNQWGDAVVPFGPRH